MLTLAKNRTSALISLYTVLFACSDVVSINIGGTRNDDINIRAEEA